MYDPVKSPSLLAAGGILVDSTCAFSDANGFRAGMAHPYQLWDLQADQPTNVLEIPLVFMDDVRGRSEEAEWDELYARLGMAASVAGEVAILFHVDYFVGNPDGISRYNELLNWLGRQGADLAAVPAPA